MQLQKVLVKNEGSCSFCSRGTIKESGQGLEFPYSEVTELQGSTVCVRVCDECLEVVKGAETIPQNAVKHLLAGKQLKCAK